MTFKLATSGSAAGSGEEAAAASVSTLLSDLGGPPDFLFAASSAAYDTQAVFGPTRRAGTSRLHGLTSCLGAMSDGGMHSEEGKGLALLGIRDPDGAYGSALMDFHGDPFAAGRAAIEQALRFAGRAGEVPTLILMSASPGNEELVIAGIQSHVGPHVPILGGSAADNTVGGQWRLWSVDKDATGGVVVSALFPSVEVSFSFKSGYGAGDFEGVVTRASGRCLMEIDGEPAAQVYNRWTNGIVQDVLGQGGNILGRTALQPLGRPVRTAEGLRYYRLAHPDVVTERDELLLFAEIEVGATVVGMRSSVDSLVAHGAEVVQGALRRAHLSPEESSGALVTYCGGCMLALDDRAPEMVDQIRAALPGVPFLGSFTFGEQGKFVGASNMHSNLMISAIVFGR